MRCEPTLEHGPRREREPGDRVVVFPARARHRDRIVALWLDLVEHHRRADPAYRVPPGLHRSVTRHLDRALRSPLCGVFLVEEAALVQGFVLAEVEAVPSLDSNRTPTCWIHELYVAPEARRRGLGLALADRAERFLRERGATRPTVRIEASNPVALQFWRKAGFVDRAHILERRP